VVGQDFLPTVESQRPSGRASVAAKIKPPNGQTRGGKTRHQPFVDAGPAVLAQAMHQNHRRSSLVRRNDVQPLMPHAFQNTECAGLH
jgi:hypothetical protein